MKIGHSSLRDQLSKYKKKDDKNESVSISSNPLAQAAETQRT